MQALATLLQAIASLLWPLLGFTALFLFRKQIADVVSRLKKGKLLGQEIELNESLDKLQRAAETVQTEVAALPQSAAPQNQTEAATADQDIARRIVSEASRSPKAALISLATEIERMAREVLATTGLLKGRRLVPIQQAVSEVHETYGLPSHVPSSLHHFWDVRNRLIHKGEGSDDDLLRAIDSGLSILRALQAMPRESNFIFDPKVDIYSDPELTKPIEGVYGVLLETHSPGGVSKSYRIFPSSKTHFVKGKQVSWEWNMGLVVGSAWYRDLKTKASAVAWSSSAEFVGRHLDEL